MDNRNRMGKNKGGVIFPVAPNNERQFQYDLPLLEYW